MCQAPCEVALHSLWEVVQPGQGSTARTWQSWESNSHTLGPEYIYLKTELCGHCLAEGFKAGSEP